MKQALSKGANAQVSVAVETGMTAAAYARDEGEAYPDVLATPVMIGEMERACAAVLRPLLAPGEMSVGAKVEIAHTAPTPVGAVVKTKATFLEQAGPLYWFEVVSEDPAGPIGRGRHARAIVPRQAIEDRASERSDKRAGGPHA